MYLLVSSFWLTCASFALSFSWLLPNHSIPWMGFHGDAWTGFILLLTSIFVFIRNRLGSVWHNISIATAFIAAIPLIQYFFGLIPLFGVAWINSCYILGFMLTLLAGATWERKTANQVGDFIFLSIGIASAVSVGLQLHQFFHLDSIGPWILMSSGSRHYANMAQPNQLASLLLLGTLACAWGLWRKIIGIYTAFFIASIFLFGTVLTESRTAWLNVMLLVVTAIIWRRILPTKNYIFGILGLSILFAICVFNLSAFNEYFGTGLPVEYRSTSGDPRWEAWKMFLKAAIHRPYFGFGWGQLGHAQFLMMDEKISFGGSFLQSHNLFLDLILWNGIPLGLTIACILIWWCISVVKSIKTFPQMILMCFLLILGTHSMFEYPLQYAYFLFPTGLIMGSLNTSLNFQAFKLNNKWPMVIVILIAALAFFITARDYFRVENSFYGLRFEQKKIASDYPRTPPNVIALTQWQDFIIFSRMEPKSDVSSDELMWMQNLVSTVPSAFGMYKLAAMLAFNDRPIEAKQWLKRLCQTSPVEQCEVIKVEWEGQSMLHSQIADIPWPN